MAEEWNDEEKGKVLMDGWMDGKVVHRFGKK